MKILPLTGLLLVSLAACNRSPEAPTADPAATAPAKDAAVPADADIATASPADPRSDSPARLDGFGKVALGASVDQVRSGWGAPLQGDVPDDGCHYLRPQDDAAAEGPLLMIEGNTLVRYDVRTPDITAPGGGKVGMTLGELQQLYPERADVGPDKYDEKAQHLRVRPAQEGAAIIDFTLQADGRVGAWRVGQTPQVDYVEGCG